MQERIVAVDKVLVVSQSFDTSNVIFCHINVILHPINIGTNKEQFNPKILKKSRTAGMNLNFTGSHKK